MRDAGGQNHSLTTKYTKYPKVEGLPPMTGSANGASFLSPEQPLWDSEPT